MKKLTSRIGWLVVLAFFLGMLLVQKAEAGNGERAAPAPSLLSGEHTFVQVVPGGSDVVPVTFAKPFGGDPRVVCTFAFEGTWPSLAGGAAHCWVTSVTANGFELRVYQSIGLTVDLKVNWIAVAP